MTESTCTYPPMTGFDPQTTALLLISKVGRYALSAARSAGRSEPASCLRTSSNNILSLRMTYHTRLVSLWIVSFGKLAYHPLSAYLVRANGVSGHTYETQGLCRGCEVVRKEEGSARAAFRSKRKRAPFLAVLLPRSVACCYTRQH